ncbi:LamG domain-containing protein [Clostridium swellfunianum]|uniref:LamG domain-containing protein n=1 Tax=Clostridium swellfunianum TaxID=1367462 RepID=UPI002030DF80|nr:LamG domain-containing protein [Clostridium swellfunianum]MCM0647315.1 LamG domain-containing protein [Clostridium swellfunianum]
MKKLVTGVICALLIFNVSALRINAENDKGLEAHYIFNEEDNKTVKDYSSKGRNLKIDGTASYGEGKEGKAFQFDGNTVLRLSATKAISGTDITVTAFINIKEFYKSDNKFTNLFVNDGLSALGKGAFDFSFDAEHKLTSYMCGNSWTEGDRVTASKSQENLNTWIHISVVYNHDSEKQLLYINGQKISENNMVKGIGIPIQMGYKPGAGNNGGDFLIGGYADGKKKIRSFSGLMDDVRIYSRALADDEISKLANDSKALTEYKSSEKQDGSKATQEDAKPQPKEKEVAVSSGTKGAMPYVIAIIVLSISLSAMVIYIIASGKKNKRVMK